MGIKTVFPVETREQGGRQVGAASGYRPRPRLLPEPHSWGRGMGCPWKKPVWSSHCACSPACGIWPHLCVPPAPRQATQLRPLPLGGGGVCVEAALPEGNRRVLALELLCHRGSSDQFSEPLLTQCSSACTQACSALLSKETCRRVSPPPSSE